MILKAQHEELEPEMIAVAAERVNSILHADAPVQPITPLRTRAKRSDAGKPREKRAPLIDPVEEIWVKLPGLHCNVACEVGRDALRDHVASGATFASGWTWGIIEQLITEIDRLRAK